MTEQPFGNPPPTETPSSDAPAPPNPPTAPNPPNPPDQPAAPAETPPTETPPATDVPAEDPGRPANATAPTGAFRHVAPFVLNVTSPDGDTYSSVPDQVFLPVKPEDRDWILSYRDPRAPDQPVWLPANQPIAKAAESPTA